MSCADRFCSARPNDELNCLKDRRHAALASGRLADAAEITSHLDELYAELGLAQSRVGLDPIRGDQLEPQEFELLKLFAHGPIPRLDALEQLAHGTALPAEAELLGHLVADLESRGFLERSPRGACGGGLSELGQQVVSGQSVLAASGPD